MGPQLAFTSEIAWEGRAHMVSDQFPYFSTDSPGRAQLCRSISLFECQLLNSFSLA